MPVNLPLFPHVKIDTGKIKTTILIEIKVDLTSYIMIQKYFFILDAQKLLVALPTLESRLPNKEPEIHYLRRFLRNRNLHIILRVIIKSLFFFLLFFLAPWSA